MVYMREDRKLLQEIVEADQEVIPPVTIHLIEVGIITDEIHPPFGGHQTAGVWEQHAEPNQTQCQVDDAQHFPLTGPTFGDGIQQQNGTEDQEGHAGKVMVDVGAAGHQHPWQELCQ